MCVINHDDSALAACKCMITLALVLKDDFQEGHLSMYDHSGSGLKG